MCRRSFSAVLLLLILTFLPGRIAAVDSGLRLVLELDRTNYAPLEPIPLEYSVVNTSNADAAVPSLIAPQYGWIQLEIAKENEAFRPYRTGVQAQAMAESAMLGPGERLASQVVVLTNAWSRLSRTHLQFAGFPLFPCFEPGKYRIRARYLLAEPDSRGEAPRLTSNTVELVVRSASPAEQEALASFGSEDEYAAAAGADGIVADLSTALGRWDDFVRSHPDSVYAQAVRLHLARLHLHGTGLPQPDPAMAATHARVLARSGPRALADDALIVLAESEIERGSVADARAALVELVERFPDSERRAQALRLRDGLDKGFRTLRDIYGN